MIPGLAVIGLATALGIWGVMRMAAANPMSRLVWWTYPPNSPSGIRFMFMGMAVLMYFGWKVLEDNHSTGVWAVLAVLLGVGAQFAVGAIHNRRVDVGA